MIKNFHTLKYAAIALIAEMSGFANRTTFNEQFRSRYKMTPSEYRLYICPRNQNKNGNYGYDSYHFNHHLDYCGALTSARYKILQSNNVIRYNPLNI